MAYNRIAYGRKIIQLNNGSMVKDLFLKNGGERR